MSNHVVIGLGGTGGRVIRSLRKQIFQNLQTDEPRRVSLRYLYLDTSDELVQGREESWRVLGRSVALPEQSKMIITGVDLRNVIENATAYPGISGWIGEKKNYTEILLAAEAASVGAGQRRRLGRFLFATNARAFVDRIQTLVNSIHDHPAPEAEATRGVTFHVCAGLAGGTGSGSLIDVLMQIRARYPQDQRMSYRIVVYAVLPARQPTHSIDLNGYYFANGYAALKELNALAVGRWQPHDITGQKQGRLALQNVFDSCYLIGDENSNGVRVNLSTEAPDLVASYLYQRIVESQNVVYASGGNVNALEGFENPPANGMAEVDDAGNPIRTTRFLSFGIKQVVYPQTEIREYLTYSFALEAARQMLFNNWDDSAGFRDEAANLPMREWVNSPAMLERWSLTQARLTLSQGILKAERENRVWKPIADFWQTTVAQVAKDIRTGSGDKKLWLLDLTKKCDELYRDRYRSSGVEQFYALKRGGDARDQVMELRGGIERDLFEEWANGEKSMTDLRRAVDELIVTLNVRVQEFDDLVAQHGPDSEPVRSLNAKVKGNFTSWAQTGILSSAIGKRDRLMDAQTQNYIALYTIRTQVEGWRYGRELAIRLRQELESLKEAVRECSRLVTDTAERLFLEVSARCQDVQGSPFQQAVVQFYEPEVIRAYVRTLTKDKKLQTAQASNVRAELVRRLGSTIGFAGFRSLLAGGSLYEAITEVCERSAVAADDERQDIGQKLRVKIVEKLRDQFGGNREELQRYWTRIMTMTGQNLQFNPTEVAMRPGSNANAMTTSVFCVVPEAPEAKQFRDELARVIQNSTQDNTTVGTNATRPQEITLLSVSSIFPARYAQVLTVLRDQYNARLSGELGDASFIALHLEGTKSSFAVGQSLPDLSAEKYTAENIRPYALLAKEMKLLTRSEDPQTGVERMYLMLPDPNGNLRAENVGRNFEAFVEEADPRRFLLLRAEVSRLLNTQYLHRTERERLASGVEMAMAEDLGRFQADPRYERARKTIGAVKMLLASEEIYAD